MRDEKQETEADIIAEMRNLGKFYERSTDRIPRSLMGLDLRTYADRLEAACKRDEKHAVEHATHHAEVVASANCLDCIYNPRGENYEYGNVAAMREALEKLKEAYYETKDGWPRFDGSICPDVFGVIEAALSAPPKNFEKYETADEAMDDFADEALIEEWNALKVGKDRDMLAKELYYFINWLFAPAVETKGGNRWPVAQHC